MSEPTPSRRDFLKTAGLGAASILLSSSLLSCGSSKRKPNIIFIMSDDHAAHAISCYGSKLNQTPNLDRIAGEGMRFTNCFCTNAICAPSRAVILTGKYSHVNGVMDNRQVFDGSQTTFPKLLQQAGYQTAMVGKWHLKSDPTGFDYWNVLPGQGDYYNPDLIEMGVAKQHTGYVTDVLTDIALNWLERRDPAKPFCLLYQHKAPHRNWMPDPKHLALFNNKDIPEPATLFDDYAARSRAAFEQEMTIARHLDPIYDLKLGRFSEQASQLSQAWETAFERMTPQQKQLWEQAYQPGNEAFAESELKDKDLVRWKYRRYMQDYLSCIASVDDNVGRVLSFLDRQDLTENSIVVYTSDQGFFLGDHGWFDKRFMYEESLRMPLMIRYPRRIKPGAINDDLVLNLDFAPTFLEAAGLPAAEGMQGASLMPLLQGKLPAGWRDAIYYHYYEYPAWHMVKKHVGIRTRQYKLIHFYDDIDAWELYDLQADPGELHNLYGAAGYSDITAHLQAQLRSLQDHYGDHQL